MGCERRKKGVKGLPMDREREVRAQKGKEEVRREREKWGEEEHAEGRGGVDGPAEPDAQNWSCCLCRCDSVRGH
jgi:hypothetical protein